MSDRDMGIGVLDNLLLSYTFKEAVGEGRNMHLNVPQSIRLSSRRQCSGHPTKDHLMRNHRSQKRQRQYFNHMKLHLILALFTNSGRNFINIVQNAI